MQEHPFKQIDLATWSRKPYFDQYSKQMKCTYSITVNLDITEVIQYKRNNGTKLYPLLIYVLTKTVNNHEEFRTAIDEKGHIGIWHILHPCYTIFHKDNETFSEVWTEWNDNLTAFLDNWEKDMALYGNKHEINPKPTTPANVFPISILPWTSFTGFNLNITTSGDDYLLPIFTFGKYFTQADRFLIPLSIQVHHAVCDGFHVSRFINEAQQICNELFATNSTNR